MKGQIFNFLIKKLYIQFFIGSGWLFLNNTNKYKYTHVFKLLNIEQLTELYLEHLLYIQMKICVCVYTFYYMNNLLYEYHLFPNYEEE